MIRRPPRSPLFPYPPLSRSIVGGGMTADAAARAIRETDPKAPIGLIGAEAHPPYNRPPLSKALWKGEPERSEEHTSELQSQSNLVCRLLLEKKKHNSTIQSL